MPEARAAVLRHYGRGGLRERIFGALAAAGKERDSLTREDLYTMDEFHTRGREATRDLARLAGLHTGMKTLDVGCGIGGPARTLADEFGCAVTGIDIVEEFVRVARELTDCVGLSGRVQFAVADALALPLADSAFDAAVLEHVSMNIEAKTALFQEIARVLRPSGVLADFSMCEGPESPVLYPVPWSEDGAASFLVTPDSYRSAMEQAGLRVRKFIDTSDSAGEFFRAVLERMASLDPGAPLAASPSILMGESAGPKMRNLLRNLREKRLAVIQAVASRDPAC